jgi:hypothetical protein
MKNTILFMRSAIYDTVILDIWSCTLWYAGLYSTGNDGRGYRNMCKIAGGVNLF